MNVRSTHFSVLAAFLILSSPVNAEDPSTIGGMGGGGVVRMDPNTQKPTHHSDQGSVPLWDGVHRMDDGSVVIVKGGVVVKDERVLDKVTQQQANDPVAAKPSDCMDLVKKLCGAQNECASNPGCSPARQMLSLEEDEIRSRTADGFSTVNLETTRQCREALHDESYFARCEKTRRIQRPVIR